MTEHKTLLPEIRFWKFVNKTNSCWLWTGYVNEQGYGKFTLRKGKKVLAHRYCFLLENGFLPEEGLHLDHLCRVRNCVNPSHLEPVTRKENILRGISPPALHAKKTHCVRGHEFTEENTFWPKCLAEQGLNGRRCRICDREKSLAYVHKVRGIPKNAKGV